MSSNSASGNESKTFEALDLLKLVGLPLAATVGLIALRFVVIPSVLVEVPNGQAAALAFGGNVKDVVLQPGPHFKLPWEQAIFMPTLTQKVERETSPTDSNNQSLTAVVVPQITIQPAYIPALARNYGDAKTLMNGVVLQQINQVTRGRTSLMSPEDLIWKRGDVVAGIQTDLQAAISEQLQAKGVDPRAILVGPVAITQFGFNPAVTETLEKKAESQVQTRIATASARIRGIDADSAGQVTEIQAAGHAEATLIVAKAKAKQAELVGEANRSNPRVGQWEAVQKWIAAGGKTPRIVLGQNGSVIINGTASNDSQPAATKAEPPQTEAKSEGQ